MHEALDVTYADGVVWTKVRGLISPKLGDEIERRVAALSLAHPDADYYFDFRSAGFVEGVISICRRGQLYDELGIRKDAKRAIVCRFINRDYEFLQRTAIGRGHDLQLFTDAHAALQWLRAKSRVAASFALAP